MANTDSDMDLPPELWFEILSYLPRTAIYKVMGVNRFLFTLAMQDKYGELRYLKDDTTWLRVLEQLQ